MEPYTIPIWFNPWRYEKEKHLIIPFLKTIEQEVDEFIDQNTDYKESFIESLKATSEKISRIAAAIAYGMNADFKLGTFGFKFDIAKIVARKEALKERRLKEAAAFSDQLTSIYYNAVNELKSAIDNKKFRLVVFIDDLDRCLPEIAVELL